MMCSFFRRCCLGTLVLISATAAEAQLSAGWVVPATAHSGGVAGTFWRTDVSLHNPHEYDLDVVVQALESGRENWSVPTMELTLAPYETVNLWDALAPELFDIDGTAAMLAYVDPDQQCDPIEVCDFLATSRTYTVDPQGSDGELGQGVAARRVEAGLDWSTFGYVAGILNDGVDFRCNIGVASWTSSWTTVQVDVQDSWGNLLDTEVLDIPPFGHVQHRLRTGVGGGSLVFYVVEGPDTALVFPYASVVDQRTGDPSFFAALPSVVGVSVGKWQLADGLPQVPLDGGEPVRLGPRHQPRAAR
jgi:hypothetical protein